MNPDTGHVVRIPLEEAARALQLEQLERRMKGVERRLADGEPLKEPHLEALRQLGYEQLPSELHLAAEKALAGEDEATVPRRSRGKLGKWAARRRRSRRKMEKATRKAQRSGR